VTQISELVETDNFQIQDSKHYCYISRKDAEVVLPVHKDELEELVLAIFKAQGKI
jgi:hypothetical protein